MNKAALVIAYYNGSEFIEKAVESAINQTLSFEQIIIVDDGSSLIESVFARDLCAKFNIEFISKSNGGQGSARNAGVNYTKAKYICFLDQDDILYSDHHELLLAKIVTQRKPQGWVYADYASIDKYGQVTKIGWVNFIALNPKTSFNQLIGADAFILPSASIISKSAFQSIGGFDEQFKGYEDDDLFLRLFQEGYFNDYINIPVYMWRTHANQTSASTGMAVSRFNFIKKWLSFYGKNRIEYYATPSLLFNRFFRTIALDYINSSTENKKFYKNIFKNFIIVFDAEKLNFKLKVLNNLSKIIYLPFNLDAFLINKNYLSLIRIVYKLLNFGKI